MSTLPIDCARIRSRNHIAAWLDQADDGRATLRLLALFVMVWTTFHIIAYASVDLHPDLVEIYAWSRHPSLGYSKHPPLGAWITWAWFQVFPVRDWSFHLLAMCNAALALFMADKIAQRYLSGDKRLMVLLLLMLTPFYQFHAQRFGANQVLLATWPLTVYCFLRAFEERTIGWSVATGAGCALAMLGKYYSVFLLAALPVAALLHPQRLAYLKSRSPWISLASALAVLSPHLYWLAHSKFAPISYAYSSHSGVGHAVSLLHALLSLAGGLGYVALPILIWALAVAKLPRLSELFRPANPEHRNLVNLLALPLLLPVIAAPLIGVELNALWTMPAWFLLPVVLLLPEAVQIRRPDATNIATLVLALTLAVFAAAPVLALTRHWYGTKEGRSYYLPLADAVGQKWSEATGRPLSIVLGELDLGAALTFYHPDRPDTQPGFDERASPWITPARMHREGYVVLCHAESVECTAPQARLKEKEPSAKSFNLTLTRTLLGSQSPPANFKVLLVPPSQ